MPGACSRSGASESATRSCSCGVRTTAAALRETLEQVGLALERARLEPAGVMHRRSGEERIDFFFRYPLAPADLAPRNAEPEKCSELLWAKLAAPPRDTVPYVRLALANLAAGRWFDEHGWDAR